MELNRELTPEEIEKITGGSLRQSADLVVLLGFHGYGWYVTDSSGRNDLIDLEGMKKFFASKGYRFIPGMSDDEQNYFEGPDGTLYGQDYIATLINDYKL